MSYSALPITIRAHAYSIAKVVMTAGGAGSTITLDNSLDFLADDWVWIPETGNGSGTNMTPGRLVKITAVTAGVDQTPTITPAISTFSGQLSGTYRPMVTLARRTVSFTIATNTLAVKEIAYDSRELTGGFGSATFVLKSGSDVLWSQTIDHAREYGELVDPVNLSLAPGTYTLDFIGAQDTTTTLTNNYASLFNSVTLRS